jgi:mannose-6-phosphate isomerase-like protein (cupin superfamily)
MEHFRVDDLDERRRAEEEPWLEFQRSASMSTGLYVLGAGEPDEQVPHAEDEIYVVASGAARFVTPDRSVQVEPGDVLFVPAREEHRFVDITEELHLVVVFAPPESLGDDE